jgi:hypothetical protein
LGGEAQEEEEVEEVQEPVPNDKSCTIEELWDRMSIQDARRETENLHTRNMLDFMHQGLNFFYQAHYDLAQQQLGDRNTYSYLDRLADMRQWPMGGLNFSGEATGQDQENQDEEERADDEKDMSDDAANAPMGIGE